MGCWQLLPAGSTLHVQPCYPSRCVCVYSKRLHVFQCVWSYVLGLVWKDAVSRSAAASERSTSPFSSRADTQTQHCSHRRLIESGYGSDSWCLQSCQGLGKDVCVNVKESRSRTMADLDEKLDRRIDYSGNFHTSDAQRPDWCWESATKGQTQFWGGKLQSKTTKTCIFNVRQTLFFTS